MSPDELELLQRHAPLLRLDLLERFAPVAVDPFLARAAVVADGERLSGPPAELAATAGSRQAGLHLDPLADAIAAGTQSPAATQPPAAAPLPLAARMFAAFAPPPGPSEWVCYGEIEPLIGGGRALSYWFFWVDNPFGIRFTDIGRHVGDWEQVQVELAPGGAIVAVTVMQHGSAHRVEAGAAQLTIERRRPRVYVAEGSHAAYLTAAAQPRKLKQDNTSDGGRSGVPRVRALDAAEADVWPGWPGRWGPDTGAVVPLPAWLVALARRLAPRGFGGDSPPGPLARGKRRAGTRPLRRHTPGAIAPNAWLSRALQRLGGATWPRRVEIDATTPVAVDAGRDAPRVQARARVGGWLLRRARYLDAVVVDADGAALGHARARVKGASIDLTIELIAAGTPAQLRLAGYNALDQRSNVSRRPVG
ncbi:Vps62-related protein [Conexibacter sp. CPCC 206217]|uniref:Vps62-related protein n=1 Tax=Conexibacter sp. CPCC 206217 TaxID=3064574 RepID=UPI0027157A68|nr:Vps62-related protein [Conexibacter sp. CPCC 206217]MDO8212700.1 Vps62-related protein [Conexibacter sp. CPCC 206217]